MTIVSLWFIGLQTNLTTSQKCVLYYQEEATYRTNHADKLKADMKATKASLATQERHMVFTSMSLSTVIYAKGIQILNAYAVQCMDMLIYGGPSLSKLTINKERKKIHMELNIALNKKYFNK